MKKLTALALAAVLCTTFTVCGKSQSDTEDKTEATQSVVKTNEYVEDDSSEVTSYYSDGSPFTPVLRFAVTGDTHLNTEWMSNTDKRLENIFSDAYAYARTQQYDKLDAVVVVGDYIEQGYDGAYEAYLKAWQKNILPETSFLCLQAGHELLSGGTKDHHKLYTGNDMGTHAVINGYHFITVSNVRSEADGEWSEKCDEECDLEWIEQALDEAVADTGEIKPIFTFHHHPIADTILSSQSKRPLWQSDPEFSKLFKRHANIVDFSAHTHIPTQHPRAIMQKDFTTLSAGAAYYSCNVSDLTDANAYLKGGEGGATCAGMTIIEVDAEGRIRMLPYNLVARDFYTEIGSGREEVQLIRYIERAGDKSTWLYTEERNNKSDLPVWSENATVRKVGYEKTVVNMSKEYKNPQSRTRLVLTFDQADDEDGIECYKLRVIRKSNNQPVNVIWAAGSWSSDATQRTYFYLGSKYYLTPVPKTVTVESTGLDPSQFIQGEEYTIELTAIDTWHNESAQKLKFDFVCEKTFN